MYISNLFLNCSCVQVPEDESHIHTYEKVRRPIAEDKAIAKALTMIKAAKHPLLLIAAGANRKITSNMLRQFVDETGMPFCNTQMGKGVLEAVMRDNICAVFTGVVDERHKCFMGTAAISSSDYIHACIDHSDLILMVTLSNLPFSVSFVYRLAMMWLRSHLSSCISLTIAKLCISTILELKWTKCISHTWKSLEILETQSGD